MLQGFGLHCIGHHMEINNTKDRPSLQKVMKQNLDNAQQVNKETQGAEDVRTIRQVCSSVTMQIRIAQGKHETAKDRYSGLRA